MSWPVSVVIAARDRPDSLARCLAGLAGQQPGPHQVLVAVRADDGGVLRMLGSPRVPAGLPLTAVPVGRADASRARNRCLAHVTGVIVAFLDDDAVPRPGWIRAIVEAFTRDPRLGGLGGPDWIDGRVVPVHERGSRIGIVQLHGRRIGNHHLGTTRAVDVDWLKGANMSFRMAALDGIRFGRGLRGRAAQFAEDVDVSLQVRRAGWVLRYDPAAAVDHHPGPLGRARNHRALTDDRSLVQAAHNETVALLRFLPPLRRVVFLGWSCLIGTRLLPGLAVALATAPRRRGLHRWRLVLRGRRSGWRAWRDDPPPMRRAPARRGPLIRRAQADAMAREGRAHAGG